MRALLCLFLLPIVIFGQSRLDTISKLIEQKQYAKAEEKAIQFLETVPQSLKGIELLGDAYAYQKKWDAAIKMYKKLVKTKKNEANYHYKHGGAMSMKALSVNKLRALGLIDDIKFAFLKAAQLDKNHIETRWALVELYMQLPGILGGSKSKSLQYASELDRISKVDGYLAKGYVYEYDDEPELAETYYKKAIKVGGSLTCFSKLTAFYEHENKPEKAIKNIEASQKKHQRNALHYQIGKIAASYNIELEKGEQCLLTYIKNYSAKDGVPVAWAQYRLAQIHRYKRNKKTALKYIGLALKALPKIEAFQKEKQSILKMM